VVGFEAAQRKEIKESLGPFNGGGNTSRLQLALLLACAPLNCLKGTALTPLLALQSSELENPLDVAAVGDHSRHVQHG
jgi:hypothetical protein